MLFNSLKFLAFFPTAVLGFYIIPRKVRYIWLLICSYYFYMSWNPKYALLILASTVFTYTGSIVIGKCQKSGAGESARWKSRLALVCVLVLNLAILIYFKYSNFLIDIFAKAVGVFGITPNIPEVDVLLPVGISFYTFQALSYSIDVYRQKIEPEKNFLKYALFVSFFPQLVAGPIERSENLLPQIRSISEKKPVPDKMFRGLLLMFWGLFLKMVIADRAAVIADKVFDRFYLYGGVELAIGAIAFAVQIYCDFSSYSTIAIGAAEVLGFTLTDNFNAPYMAGSIQEFWRRWHISLSAWFRDYLYIPLGGSRCGRLRKYLNIMVTFLVSGLWHGAAMTYVVWGGLHGLYQIVGDLTAPLRGRLNKAIGTNVSSFGYRFGRIAGTFVLTDIAWIFFRAKGLHAALSYIKRMVIDFNPWVLSNGIIYKLGLGRMEINMFIFAVVMLIASDLLLYFKGQTAADFIIAQNPLFKSFCILLLLLLIFIFGMYGPQFDSQAFIYFQF